MSHSFFGLSVAKTSPIPAAVKPNLYATDPTGFKMSKDATNDVNELANNWTNEAWKEMGADYAMEIMIPSLH